MKKFFNVLCLMSFFLAFSGTANSATIYNEDFEDSDGFTLGGGYAHSWIYWGIAPLSGTTSVPSNFVQGGGQAGNIFYGSFAKASAAGGPEEPSPTMTISLPDLTGYTDLGLVVALAAPAGVWESTHRDSLYINGTTGLIDSFLPPARPSSLRSQVYSSDLLPGFKDFEYDIDSGINSLTFTFASTDYNEIIGIDSVIITGNPLAVTPEPLSMILFGLGSGVLALAARRRAVGF